MTDLQETPVQLSIGEIGLEGRLASLDKRRGAVITHPHTQYGGSLDNPVVETITRAYQSRGWTTLRFNFRGAGNSQGTFDDGIGEQKDMDAAVAFLAQKDMKKIEVAGYSFGSWVASLWAQHNSRMDCTLRLIAPPVAFMDYQAIGHITGLAQVLVGSRDDIAPAAMVDKLMRTWEPRADLRIIENADHFFWNHMTELESVLSRSIPE